MEEVVLQRHLKAGIERVFDYISVTDNLLEWWGPEGLTVPKHNLSFQEPGPWFSEMHAPDGSVYKVSGQVTRVDPPRAVAFTWGWHDDEDQRGHESHVTIELAARDGGTDLTLTHRNLADDQSAQSHVAGWTSSLAKLERKF